MPGKMEYKRVKRNKMKKLFFAMLIIYLFAACEKGKMNSDVPELNSIPEGMTGSSVVIGAAGGEVAIAAQTGSINLLIPPGALSSPTAITIYTPQKNTDNIIRLGFEPDGLEFQKPVRLKVSLSQDLFTTHALTNLLYVSENNELIDAGSEQHRWKRLENIEIDPSGESIFGEMEHFSTGLVLLGIQRTAYMVIDLPGKYLRPGDGLFVMSAGSANYKYHWVPGHVAIVNSVHPDDGTRDGNLDVLESTLDGGLFEDRNGVQLNPFLRFKRTAGHLYMGARRPTKSAALFKDAERLSAVEFARDKLGSLYGYLGGIDPSRWTCSELVEAAWDAAGHGVFVFGKDFFPSPVEMFEKTNYISEITVKVGEEVKIPVYPVVIDKSSDVIYSAGFYLAGKPAVDATMLVRDTPEGSGWTVDNTHVYKARTFTWTPKASDAGKTVTLNFEMSGSVKLDVGYSVNYNIKKHLDIHVRGASTEIEITPVQKGSDGLTYTYHFPVPQGAIIGPNSQDHLIDKATGLYPVNPVFTDQVLDKFEEGWLNETTKTHYGMRLHIKRLDPPFDPAPTGSHTWIYSIDYKTPYYTGD